MSCSYFQHFVSVSISTALASRRFRMVSFAVSSFFRSTTTSGSWFPAWPSSQPHGGDTYCCTSSLHWTACVGDERMLEKPGHEHRELPPAPKRQRPGAVCEWVTTSCPQ